MPIGIVSDEDFLAEKDSLSSESKPKSAAVIIEKKHGGRVGNEVPSELRRVIGEDAIESGNTKEIAKAYGVSKSAVDAYKHGATSSASYNKRDLDLSTFLDRRRTAIANQASRRLSTALRLITEEKLANEKPRDLASIAVDMSRIVEKSAPKAAVNVQNNVVFYTPQRVKEESLGDVIDV